MKLYTNFFLFILLIVCNICATAKSNKIIIKTDCYKHILLAKTNNQTWYLIDSFATNKKGIVKINTSKLNTKGLYYIINKDNIEQYLPVLINSGTAKITITNCNFPLYKVITNNQYLSDFFKENVDALSLLITTFDTLSINRIEFSELLKLKNQTILENREKLLLKNPKLNLLYQPTFYSLYPIIYQPNISYKLPFNYSFQFNDTQFIATLNNYNTCTNCYPIYSMLLNDYILNYAKNDTIKLKKLINEHFDALQYYPNSFINALNIVVESLSNIDFKENENTLYYLYNNLVHPNQQHLTNNKNYSKILKYCLSLSYIKQGNQFYNFTLRDTLFNKINIANIDGEKLIVIFWNPSSIADNKQLSAFKKTYNNLNLYSLGYRVLLISISNYKEHFLKAMHLLNQPNWIFTEDRSDENILQTPNYSFKSIYANIFILDKNKKIIDKGVSILSYNKLEDFP